MTKNDRKLRICFDSKQKSLTSSSQRLKTQQSGTHIGQDSLILPPILRKTSSPNPRDSVQCSLIDNKSNLKNAKNKNALGNKIYRDHSLPRCSAGWRTISKCENDFIFNETIASNTSASILRFPKIDQKQRLISDQENNFLHSVLNNKNTNAFSKPIVSKSDHNTLKHLFASSHSIIKNNTSTPTLPLTSFSAQHLHHLSNNEDDKENIILKIRPVSESMELSEIHFKVSSDLSSQIDSETVIKIDVRKQHCQSIPQRDGKSSNSTLVEIRRLSPIISEETLINVHSVYSYELDGYDYDMAFPTKTHSHVSEGKSHLTSTLSFMKVFSKQKLNNEKNHEKSSFSTVSSTSSCLQYEDMYLNTKLLPRQYLPICFNKVLPFPYGVKHQSKEKNNVTKASIPNLSNLTSTANIGLHLKKYYTYYDFKNRD